MICMPNEMEIAIKRMSPGVRSLKSRVFRAGSWLIIGFGAGQIIRLAGNLRDDPTPRTEPLRYYGHRVGDSISSSRCSRISAFARLLFKVPMEKSVHFLIPPGHSKSIQGWWIWGLCSLIALGLHTANAEGWLPADFSLR